MKTKSPRHGLRAARRACILARTIFIALPLGLLPCASPAASGSWNTDASGNWTTASNWAGSTIAGNNPGDTASLTQNITAARTVTVDGSNKTIGVLDIGDSDNTHAYTLGGSTALYFNNNASPARINQLATSKGDTINTALGIIGNGTLAITNASANTLTIGSYTQSGASGAATVILDTGSGAIDYKGPIVNGGAGRTLAVVKNGSGTLRLTGTAGNSTYSGGFTLNAGTLEFGYSQTALGTGVFTLNGGVITNGYGAARALSTANPQVWNADLAFGSATSSGQDLNLGSGPVTLTGNRVVTVSSTNTARTLTVGGPVSGAFSLTKAGNATLRLDGAGSYSGGTTVHGGKLVVGATGSLGSGNLNLVGGAVVFGNASALSGNSILTFPPSASAGSIGLDFSGAMQVASVTDGIKHAIAGTYTASQLNAFFGTSVFTGTGSLTVGSWVSVPLGGGGFVTGLVSDSTGADIYARTDVGGVFRWVPSTGGNGAWLSITDTLVPTTTPDTAPLLFTSSVAVDPNDSAKLYISVGSPGSAINRGIFASSDRGATWTKINPSDDIVMDGNGTYRLLGERLAVDPNNSGILWFGSTQQGLYKGVKSGASWTWTQIPATSVPFGALVNTASRKAGVTFVACDPNAGSTIVYAGVFDNTSAATGGVYRSTDGGATWAKVPGVAIPTPARGHVAANGALYVTGNGVVARLPRGGSLAAITPLANVNYRAVAADPSVATGDTVYVAEANHAAQNNRIWRSTDGGSSWVRQDTNFNDNRSIPRSEPDGTPCVTGYWFGGTSSMLVTPAAANTLWAADAFGVARTENAHQLGGSAVGSQAIWHMLQVNQEETYVEALKNAPTGPALLTALADVGGYRYNDISQRPVGAAGNAFDTPSAANVNSLDFSEGDPSVWVRTWTGTVGNGTTNGFYGTGAYSRDAGENWLLFGEIDRRNMTGAAGWEIFDLTAYLTAQKAKGINIVTLMLSSGRPSNGGGSVQIFASKENNTVANRPTLLLNGVTPLSPTDDATVFGQSPTGNYKSSGSYGNQGSFDIFYNAGDNAWYRHAYLKFDLSGVSTITEAKLRIYRTSTAAGFTVPVGVFACADTSWTQDTLIWNNRPMPYASNIGQPFYAPRYTTGAGLTIGGGRVAVSSTNPNQLVWMPLGTATVPHYSDDRGVTWHPSSGLPANVNHMISKSTPSYLLHQLTADRVDGSFYIWHLYENNTIYKRIYKSTDGGINWSEVGAVPFPGNFINNTYRCQIVAAPAAGHVWMSDDGINNTARGGLWKTVNGGVSSVQLPNISGVRVVSFGKPPAGSSYHYSTYFMGHYNGVKGVYRSDDYGATWTALPALPSVGNVDSIAGDRQVHGSVFIGVGGRGVFQTQ